MIFNYLQANLLVKDDDFDKIYPKKIARLSKIHWTSVEVAKKAAKFLVTNADSKVMDIGSGVGKFCLVGSATTPGQFFGVEQRQELVSIAQEIACKRGLDRVHFINANMMDVNLKGFSSFYLFNPFYEHIDQAECIDKTIPLSIAKFTEYEQYLFNQLNKMPTGTRIATYHVGNTQIPDSYQLQEEHFFGLLRFYIKSKKCYPLVEKLLNFSTRVLPEALFRMRGIKAHKNIYPNCPPPTHNQGL